MGHQAMISNNVGSNNVALGGFALTSATNTNHTVAIGDQAGRYITGGATSLTSISSSILIGYRTKALGQGNVNQIVIGYDETGLGDNKTIIGNTNTTFTALRGTVGIGTTTLDSTYKLQVVGGDATINGVRVGTGANSLSGNTALGNGALGATTGAGGANTAVGSNAGGNISTGANNTTIGSEAGSALTVGSFNILIGNAGKALTTGDNNVVIGYNAGLAGTTSTKNTYVGYNAGRTGSNNTAIGAQTLTSVVGSNNTALGQNAGNAVTAGANNICLGYYGGAYATTQSGQLFIGSYDNSNYAGDQTKSIIYGQQSTASANQILTVNGTLCVNTSSPSASAAFQIDSTTKGFLPPRMTSTQRLAVVSASIGLHVYQTDVTEGVYVYKSTGWVFAY